MNNALYQYQFILKFMTGTILFFLIIGFLLIIGGVLYYKKKRRIEKLKNLWSQLLKYYIAIGGISIAAALMTYMIVEFVPQLWPDNYQPLLLFEIVCLFMYFMMVVKITQRIRQTKLDITIQEVNNKLKSKGDC